LYNRPEVAVVPSGLCPTPPIIKIIKKYTSLLLGLCWREQQQMVDAACELKEGMLCSSNIRKLYLHEIGIDLLGSGCTQKGSIDLT
jgi:hypothetical protein